MTTDNTTRENEALASSDLFAIEVLTPEFLYKALRPNMSWEINADKPHWEYEAWKLQSALMRLLPQACRYHRGVNEGRPAESCPECRANAEAHEPEVS